MSCNTLRKISTFIAKQLQRKDLQWLSGNIGYPAPESSDKSPRNLRPLNIRTRANNVRSLFSNELCNFSANSWAEDQRDANELGFCAGRVVWVDPSSIMLGKWLPCAVPCKSSGLPAARPLILTSHLFGIDDGEYPHKRLGRRGQVLCGARLRGRRQRHARALR